MPIGCLIITVPGADIKLINELLLYLRDWEYGTGDWWDHFQIACTENDIKSKHGETSGDAPPVHEFSQNPWEGMAIEDIEASLIGQPDINNDTTKLFVLLDEKGVEERTVIVAKRAIDRKSDEFRYLDAYNKVRVPWNKAYIMWCNLDLANMDFEEFCDQDLGCDENFWWKYQPFDSLEDDDEIVRKRSAIINELKKLDLI